MKLLSRFAGSLLLVGLILAASSRVALSAPPAEMGPDETIRFAAKSIGENHPEVVWQLLPKSYQADVNDLIVEFAGKMDAELWNTSFNVTKKLTKVLAEKKDFILNHPLIKNNPKVPKDDISKNWQNGVELLSTLVNSDISNLDNLKKPNVEKFLTDTVGKLMKQAAAISAATPDDKYAEGITKITQSKVTLVEKDDDSATIKVETAGEEPEEEDLVKVEGRWVPEKMAEEWKESMEKAKAGLGQISAADLAAVKGQVMPIMTMVEGSLDKMLAAKSQDDFDDAANELQGMVLGMVMKSQGGPGGPGGFAPPPPSEK